MAKAKTRKKRAAPKLGSGMAEKAKKKIQGRAARLREAMRKSGAY
jgi:hypothetical protein